ncbi:NPCBM/NEW2 domain-containing protein [Peribacillus alkalitolerans]|uniref:NPCBM/NEW2 domain-containing protein n=1 Tax=Peribacillus alkalitolerans TaxID=1550385 RepID=UPI0013D5C177|nr:NPCBM/NEW2 domain-containing protein [Peribacillus alkalitolerans]
MKKKSLIGLLFVFTILLGSAFSPNSALAGDTVASLKKQVIQLKEQVKSLTNKVKSKDQEIAKLKKENATLKANAATASKTKVSYKGIVKTGIITYKNNQYIPVSYVKDVFEIPVTYDRKTDINYVGVKPNGSYISDIIKPYYSSTDVKVNEKIVMGQESYYKGYKFLPSGYTKTDVNFNLNKKYTNLKGKIGFYEEGDDGGYYSRDTIIQVFGDGELLKEIELNKGDLPMDIDLDILNVKQLQFKINSSYAVKIGLADCIIK